MRGDPARFDDTQVEVTPQGPFGVAVTAPAPISELPMTAVLGAARTAQLNVKTGPTPGVSFRVVPVRKVKHVQASVLAGGKPAKGKVVILLVGGVVVGHGATDETGHGGFSTRLHKGSTIAVGLVSQTIAVRQTRAVHFS